MSALTAKQLFWLWGSGIGLFITAVGAGLWHLRLSRQHNVDRRLRGACFSVLANFVIPDGNNEKIQVQYALFTHRGILILDIKDVKGHVFGSEAMQDWTVIADDRRFTFPNPQPGLWDRVAAVKYLTPDVPVTGFVGFTARAKFTKGQPRSVTLLEPLLEELERDALGARERSALYQSGWDRLTQAAVSARSESEVADLLN